MLLHARVSRVTFAKGSSGTSHRVAHSSMAMCTATGYCCGMHCTRVGGGERVEGLTVWRCGALDVAPSAR